MSTDEDLSRVVAWRAIKLGYKIKDRARARLYAQTERKRKHAEALDLYLRQCTEAGVKPRLHRDNKMVSEIRAKNAEADGATSIKMDL